MLDAREEESEEFSLPDPDELPDPDDLTNSPPANTTPVDVLEVDLDNEQDRHSDLLQDPERREPPRRTEVMELEEEADLDNEQDRHSDLLQDPGMTSSAADIN